LRGVHLGRPLTVAASVIVAFALLLGGAVVISRKALPGDALYGLKRASERLELATAGSDLDKAHDYLDFAASRVGEARSLSKDAGDAETAQLIGSTLRSSDADVRAAARLLGTHAVKHASAKSLSTMTGWAPGQERRLEALAAGLSDPTLRSQALSSLRLVRAAQARALALAAKMGCSCLSSANADALGPKPCTTCSAPVITPRPATKPAVGHSAGNPHPSQATHRGSSGSASGSAAHHGSGGQVAVPPKASGSPTPSAPGASTSKPPITLPSLPTGSASLPVAANSCGVTVSLPILGGVGVGLCSGVSVKIGH
jgi:hypothetical protein